MAFLQESGDDKFFYIDRYIGSQDHLKEWVYVTPDAYGTVTGAGYFATVSGPVPVKGDLIRVYQATSRTDLSTTTSVYVLCVTNWASGNFKIVGSDVSVSDGDKGDITVSGVGTAWTIDNDAVTNTKLADMAQSTIKLRAAGAGTGDPIDGTAAQARTVIDPQLADFLQAGTGAVARTIQAKLRDSVSVKDFGAVGDGVTDDATVINAAIAAAAAAGGGSIQLPLGTIAIGSTIAFTTPNIFLLGYGADLRHVAGAQFTGAATRLKWIGANGGTMVSFISPSGAGNNKMTGGGLRGISLDANSLAGIGLDIQSWVGGRFENLQLHEFLTVALNLDVVAALSDARDTQENVFQQIRIWQGAQNGIALRLQATTPGANPSLNTFDRLRIQHKDGNGIELNNCDNNHFFNTTVSLTAAGTGQSVILNGGNVAAAYVARSNVFDSLTCPGVAPISKGTASFTYPAYGNSFLNLDADNNTLVPIVEAGSYIGELTFKDGERRETTIASAATTDLGASPTERVAITGTATITSFGTVINRRRICRSGGAHTLTHNATSLILPGNADIVCADSDTWIAESGSTGNWRVKQFTRASMVPSSTGTYTPTLFNVTNVAASTAYVCQWLCVGDVVTVSGKVDIDPTAAAATELGMSLPVASNFANPNNLGGTGVTPAIASQCAGILADAVNDRASLQFVAVSAAALAMHFSFTYRII